MNFINGNRIPTVMEFDDDAIEIVFQSGLSTLFLFHDDSVDSKLAR